MAGGKEQTSLQKTLRKLMKGNISTVIALIVLCLIFGFASPYFFTFTNVMNIGSYASIMGTMASGLTVAMLLGGLDVSEIEFIVSQYGHGPATRSERAHGSASAGGQKPPLPELTGSEQKTVEELAGSVPESLRQSVYKAMSLSFRREKSRDTKDGSSRL